MSLEWKSCKIGDLGKIFSGGTPSTKIKEYWDGDLNWLSSGETRNTYIYTTDKFITEEGANNSSTKLANKGDIVIASAGQGFTRGQSSMVMIDTYVNQSVIVISPNDKVNNHYLLYNLKFRYPELRQLSDHASTRGSLTTKIIKGLDINLPDLNTQNKIATIIQYFDKKIETNKRINKNLEQLIKHIYINWFEEFEPFKDLNFYDTKLGRIPVGWEVVPLQKFIKFQEGPGIRNWQYVEEDGVNFLNIRCIQNNDLSLDTANMISKEEASGKYAHFMLNEWDLVISSSGTLGRYAIVRNEHLPVCLNTSIIRFSPLHSFNHYAYVYSYLTSRGFYHYLLTMGSGSVQLNFGPTHLKQIDLIVPPENILKKYNDLIFPLIEQMVTIKSEISKLTKLRDTLLPKLMSGEIDVSKINCDLE